jgi:hypothetical protein
VEKFSWLWGLIDENSFGLLRSRELSELSKLFGKTGFWRKVSKSAQNYLIKLASLNGSV